MKETSLWDRGMVTGGPGQKPDRKKMTQSIRQWYGHWRDTWEVLILWHWKCIDTLSTWKILIPEEYWFWKVFIFERYWYLKRIESWKLLILLVFKMYWYYRYIKSIDTFDTRKYWYLKWCLKSTDENNRYFKNVAAWKTEILEKHWYSKSTYWYLKINGRYLKSIDTLIFDKNQYFSSTTIYIFDASKVWIPFKHQKFQYFSSIRSISIFLISKVSRLFKYQYFFSILICE